MRAAAWEAGSPGPVYASTSTTAPVARRPSTVDTSRAPSKSRATLSADRSKKERSNVPGPGVPLRQPSIRLNRKKTDALDSVVSCAEPRRIWAPHSPHPIRKSRPMIPSLGLLLALFQALTPYRAPTLHQARAQPLAHSLTFRTVGQNRPATRPTLEGPGEERSQLPARAPYRTRQKCPLRRPPPVIQRSSYLHRRKSWSDS